MVVTRVVKWAGIDPVAVAGRPRRLVPLVLGFEPISEGMSLRGGSAFRYLMEPVTAAAVEFDRGWILLDGGFDPTRLRDAERRVRSFTYENYLPIIPPGDPLVDQVVAAGLDWSDLAAAALSHAHFDHTGATRLLREHQPLLMQQAEWEHVCRVPSERAAFLFREDFEHPELTIALLDGDTELAGGLVAIDTAGHTPGHQSFVVELAERTVVLAADAADLRSNLVGRIPPGSTVGPDGEPRARAAIERLADLEQSDDRVQVWPGHDPSWSPWQDVVLRY